MTDEEIKKALFLKFVPMRDREKYQEESRDYYGYPAVVRVLIDRDGKTFASAGVLPASLLLLTRLGMKNTDELFEAARKNMEVLFPWRFQSMEDVLEEGGEKDLAELSFDTGFNILSSGEMWGASVILYDGVVREMSEIAASPKCAGGVDLWLLPSSIHEWIAVSVQEGTSKDETFRSLKDMVKMVNQTDVDPEDVLGEKLLYYSYADDRIMTEDELFK